MARKSRKGIQNAAPTPEAKTYKTAIYVRLSSIDERKIESDSVENQKELLLDYIKKDTSLTLADTYVDSGFTGTNFNRPEFNRMMADVKAGRINCVVVKDLSRLGRNYLEAGDYIEKIFPFFGVRFISVTDNYDSLTSEPTEDGLVVPLKNLINEAYAKDISKKASSAYESKFKAGIYTAFMAPYGYTRVENDIHALTVDEKARPVVVRIFTEYAGGKSMVSLAKELNADGIPSPTQHFLETGARRSKTNSTSRWMVKTLRQIMLNPVYIGDIEMGKERAMLFKGIKRQKMAKEDRYYIKNHHEAIISREIYDAVQKRMQETQSAYKQLNDKPVEGKNTREAILGGILFCGDCKHPMYMRRRTRKIKSGYGHYSYYACSRSGVYENDPKKYLNASKTEAIIAGRIRDHIAAFTTLTEKIKALNNQPMAINRREAFENDIRVAQTRKAKITEILKNLYHDFTDGVFSEDEYLEVKKSYVEEIEHIEEAIEKARTELGKYDPTCIADSEMAEAFRKYKGFDQLTSDIVKTFIKKIYYYSADRIEIEYVFHDRLQALINNLKSMEEAA